MPESIKIGTIAVKNNKAVPPNRCEAYVWFNDHTKIWSDATSRGNKRIETEFKNAYWNYYDACCNISGVQNKMNTDLVHSNCLLLANLLNVSSAWEAAITDLLVVVASD